MRRFTLFVISSSLIFPAAAFGRQDKAAPPASGSNSAPTASGPSSQPAPQKSATSSGSFAPPPSSMSPEKNAEMRADILMARKEYSSAIDTYSTILKTQPKNAVVLNKIGIAYQQMGGIDAAENYYKRAAKADKKMSNPLNNLGTIEYGLKHYSKAIGYYKRALVVAPSGANTYFNLGVAYYADKKYELAMDAFSKAMQIDPEVFERHGGSGGTELQQRSASNPGLLNFYLAKSFAKAGDAARTARYLKLARDNGYPNMANIAKDKDFAPVIKDPRVQDVLLNRPSFAGDAPTAESGNAPKVQPAPATN